MIITEKIESAAKIIEPSFALIAEQKEYYEKITKYFNKEDGELDIKKGLIVCGTVGTGKTLSFRIMQKVFGSINIVSTRHIIREYMADGVKVLDRYGRKSFSENERGNIELKKPIHYCFDDMLLEEVNAKFYGNNQNIMAEILLDRYDMFVRHGMKTYATTNGDMKLLEDNYGTRVRDRIREMCNIVSLTGKSLRK